MCTVVAQVVSMAGRGQIVVCEKHTHASKHIQLDRKFKQYMHAQLGNLKM
jgi:hypothetical protein